MLICSESLQTHHLGTETVTPGELGGDWTGIKCELDGNK